MPLSGLKKEHLLYSKNTPSQLKNYQKLSHYIFFLNRIYKSTSENKAEPHIKRNTITPQKKTEIILQNIFSGNSQSGLMLTRPVKNQGFMSHSSQFRLQFRISIVPGNVPNYNFWSVSYLRIIRTSLDQPRTYVPNNLGN